MSLIADDPCLEKFCAHCGQASSDYSSSSFCCAGCESVFGILQSKGLGDFYKIRKRVGALGKKQNLPSASQSYAYLNGPAFLGAYAERDGLQMRFYLDGVHCAAYPQVAEEFELMGYRPHPVEIREAPEAESKENRRQLLRIGVAAACAGDLMLLSISVYAGGSGGFGETFQWLSLVLFAPVLTFCALPFFRNAMSALKSGRLSIDVPIAFGISAGSAGSIWNLFEGSRDIYFDSISGFIFLLLSSRYLLSRVQAKAADATHLLHFLTPSRAERMSADGPFKTVPSDSLNVGDIVEVSGGPIVPVDGVVVLGRTELSRSWMTGESKSVSIGPGDKVLAGSVSETGALQIRTTAAGASTRLGEILRQTDRTLKSKSKAIQIADRMAQYFVPLTFIFIGVGFLFGFRAGFSEGVARAVALAIPLLMSLAIGRLAKRGILVRGADVLEKLSKVKTVFFDKTGTVWQVISRLVRSPG